MQQPAEPGIPTTWVDLIKSAGPEVIIVLIVTGVLSLASWFIIATKWWQFRRISRQSTRFFQALETSTGLREGYKGVIKLKPSPFNRVFKEGVTFYTEINPGALTESFERGKFSLTDAQLEETRRWVESMRAVVEQRLAVAAEAKKVGRPDFVHFALARPDHPLCSKKWCPWFNRCFGEKSNVK